MKDLGNKVTYYLHLASLSIHNDHIPLPIYLWVVPQDIHQQVVNGP